MVVINEAEYLSHYGILRRSGRYPWNSGGKQTQSAVNKSFLGYINEMRAQGLTPTQIAKGVGVSTTELRAATTIAKNEQKQSNIAMALSLKDKGYSNVAAAERMGVPESTFRSLIAPGAKDRADVLTTTAEMLKGEVDAKRFVDVGSGVETQLGMSKERLAAAVAILEEQGYSKQPVKIRQVATGKDTEFKVLVPPGVTQREAWETDTTFNKSNSFQTMVEDLIMVYFLLLVLTQSEWMLYMGQKVGLKQTVLFMFVKEYRMYL